MPQYIGIRTYRLVDRTKEAAWEYVDWIYPAQNKYLSALENMIMGLRSPYEAENLAEYLSGH
jgi:hypothetical protein